MKGKRGQAGMGRRPSGRCRSRRSQMVRVSVKKNKTKKEKPPWLGEISEAKTKRQADLAFPIILGNYAFHKVQHAI